MTDEQTIIWKKVDLDSEYRQRIIDAHNRASKPPSRAVNGKNFHVTMPQLIGRVNENGLPEEYERTVVTDKKKHRDFRVTKPLFDKDVTFAKGETLYDVEEKIELDFNLRGRSADAF